jgi:hypothetical protein
MSENQNLETNNQREIIAVNSPEDSIIEADIPSVASESETAKDESPASNTTNNEDGELPEFAKRRLGKVQKQHEREVARLRAELDEVRARPANVSPQQFNAGQQGYIDPITQKYIDVSTPDGQAIYNYQQEMSKALTEQEKQNIARQEKEFEYKLQDHVQSSFEDAAVKHSDFENVMKNSGMSLPFAKELGYFDNPGELGYY